MIVAVTVYSWLQYSEVGVHAVVADHGDQWAGFVLESNTQVWSKEFSVIGGEIDRNSKCFTGLSVSERFDPRGSESWRLGER